MTSSGFGDAAGRPAAPAPVVVSEPTEPALREAVPAEGDFERLRELLLGGERRELAAARARIEELERAQRDLPGRLPDAAVEALRSEHGNPRVAAALSEPVAQALGAAVQTHRQSLVDALFPILGPMIRKSIAEALRSLVANLNGAIESSFTVRGLKWRFEAWRGGVPYAEVVLKHRLAYGIDHVFLIERASGLVLHHASAPGLPPLDADAIAGMLTALGDFVGDSVGGDSSGALESAQVGEDLVWVEHGPRANLACFVHGVPPAQLRTLMEQRLEEVHARLLALPADAPLRSIGDDALVRERLEPSALLRDTDEATAPVAARKASRLPLLVIALLAIALLGGFAWQRWRWDARVDALRARLAAHPGFMLTGIDARAWRALTVHGLLDPDAEPLDAVLADAGLGAVVPVLDANGYVCADDAVIARRAARLLAPPASAAIAVHGRVLRLSGTAAQPWIDAALARAPWIAGVARVESTLAPTGDAVADARAEIARIVAELQARHVAFVQDDEPVAGADAVVDELAASLRRIAALAPVARVDVETVAYGSNDDSGGSEANARVRAQRAQWLERALVARGIAGARVADAAEPSDAPNRRGAELRTVVREAHR
ncbi:hypothetical protein FHW12_003380 [Dokdonella fugitiva]|uniref:Outer membrane protein OmpA-like peptidoglycan-associated protein n=1 Tax=Dokdonella fugitiva TaxID=328517 RepID=A0A839EWV4_9GAMM|nr:hypothetical protein [Dokdonella fugitiva]MBA8889137.1 hypothetical protein [Dokdonella fugitiva]